MARGILSRRRKEKLTSTVWGGAWGLVVGGVIVAVASQLAVRHDLMLPQPEAGAVVAPEGTEFVDGDGGADPAVPGGETVPAADLAAVTPAAPEPADSSPSLDTSPAAAPAPAFTGPAAPDRPVVPGGAEVALTDREGLRPETAGAPEARAPLPPRTDRPAAVARDVPAPPVREAAPVAEAATEPSAAPAPSAPATETAALTPPAEDAAPVLGAAPGPAASAEAPAAPAAAPDAGGGPAAADAPAPVVASLEAGSPGSPEAGEAPAAPETVAEAAPAAPVPSAPAGEAPAAAPELARDVADAPADPAVPEAADVAVAAPEAGAGPGTESPTIATPAAPEATPDVPERPRTAEVARPAMEPPAAVSPRPERLEIAQAPDAGGGMAGVPAASIGERVGTLPGTRAAAEETPGAAAEEAAAPATGGRALADFRRDFSAEPGLARLAVVLVHDSAAPPDEAALAALPGEVSFAVDGGSANARAIAAAYRAAGREVVLIPSIPSGATAQDVEVALQANLRAVNEAVAVMDTGEAGFQGDREAVGQVVAAIRRTGHGLITAPQGLNTAQQIAGRFDVPAALIFDDLGAGVDAGSVSRALDRAAFRARQEEGVIILGRADAATVAGLGEWLTGRNAQSLALAPVSAVLAPEAGGSAEIETEVEAAGGNGLPRVRALPDSRSN